MSDDILHVIGLSVKDWAPKAAGGGGKKAPPKAEKWFACSSEVVDRSGEIIEQTGWRLDRFRANPVMLAAHQHRLADGKSPVIGNWPHMAVESGVPLGESGTGTALVGGAVFARKTELGKEYGDLYDDDFMRAVSVGFQPIDGERRMVGGERVYVHTAQELIEVSAVAVGCNQEALSRLRALGYEAAAATTEQGARAVAAEIRGAMHELIEASLRDLRAWIEGEIDGLKALMPDDLGERAANVHFVDHLENGELRFDYRMRPGVVEKSNALALMRAVGLDV